MDALLGRIEQTAGKHTYGYIDGALSWIRQLAYDRSNTAFLASSREVPVLVQLRWLRIRSTD
jgi:hypothetical protein